VYVGRVCPAAGCKTNFQICIEVTVATTHPTRNLVEFQHTLSISCLRLGESVSYGMSFSGYVGQISMIFSAGIQNVWFELLN
jgi:hypothetical protein